MSSSKLTLRKYLLNEIKDVTNNFDDQFYKELNTMSEIKHPNIASPLGYYDESGKTFLLYEYMEKGRLNDYVNKESLISLSWLTRIRICLDAARGLRRLHMETDEFPKGIIHRDVKPSTILLGKDWVAKMEVSGIPKFSHAGQVKSTMITDIKGTMGYYAPEYIRYFAVTRKIDVYAFGVVLFQVLCLKSPWDRGDESFYETDDEDYGIWAQENVDPRIIAEISDESLKKYTAIINATLKQDPRKRPTMDSLVLNLEKVLILASKGRAASAMKWKGTGLDYTEDKKRVLKLLETEAEAEKKGRAAGESNDERSTARYRRR